ncbi:MAG TPA: glycosyltransferase, partial [Casimicrobiaceae bacterium]|nr:glycosyltransferase [Casimicrobiaceae bacterium]
LERYLVDAIGVDAARVTNIVNGVDLDAFQPRGRRARAASCPFKGEHLWLCGTVGRLQPVKNQILLARAFVRALTDAPSLRSRMRLIIVGDGPLHADIRTILEQGGVTDLAWLTGARSDVADLLRMLDVFVLPSLAEGISNTILEAMATALPVIATDVGGNAELVEDGVTGMIVPVNDIDRMAGALTRCAEAPDAARNMGLEGRKKAERVYGIDAMVAQYDALYTQLLARSRGQGRRGATAATGQLTTESD